jgi:type II secretory pathway component PulK
MSEQRGLFSPENLQAFVAVAFVVALMALSVAFFHLRRSTDQMRDLEIRLQMNQQSWQDLATRLDRVVIVEGAVRRLEARVEALEKGKAPPPPPPPVP